MKSSFEMLKGFVKAYESFLFPENYLDVDVKVLDNLNDQFDRYRKEIIIWACVLVHEMEGEENDV